MKRLACAAALVAVVFVGSVGVALAGPPGSWTRVTDPNGVNIDEVGLARTPDTALHLVWRARFGALNEGVKHRSVSAAGAVGAEATVAQAFSSVANPAIVVTSAGGLQAFFGGLGSSDPANGIQSAGSDASGAAWSTPGKVSSARYISGVGAAMRPDGVPMFAWYKSFEVAVHTGVNPLEPDSLFPTSACCHYDPGLAVDPATGETTMAYFSNITGAQGTFVRRIAPSPGPDLLAPGSVTNGSAVQQIERTSIVPRVGGGTVVGYCSGYPTCRKALLWRAGSPKALVAGTSTDLQAVSAAPGPAGRIWATWYDDARDTIYAARTNQAATIVGAAVAVRPPKGTQSVWNLTGDGSLGRLDLLAHLSTPGAVATWHTQVLPGLTLVAGGKKLITFVVKDAGAPVSGVKIAVGGKTLLTNAKGAAKVDLPKGSFTAKATKAGYSATILKVASL
jgi:hypothetical protein